VAREPFADALSVALVDLIEWQRLNPEDSVNTYISTVPRIVDLGDSKPLMHSEDWLAAAIQQPEIRGACMPANCRPNSVDWVSILFVGVDSVVTDTVIVVRVDDAISRADASWPWSYSGRLLTMIRSGGSWKIVDRSVQRSVD
jgi:hypothetical protein